MPQPRSTTVEAPNAVSRAARWEATESRVACSRPSGVKYIDAASSPNFVDGPLAQVGLGQRDREPVRRRTGRGAGQCDAGAQRVRLVEGDGEREHVLAVLGLQPRHGVDVHDYPLPRTRAGTPLLRVLVSVLALSG